MKKLLLLKKDYSYFPIGIAHVLTALRKNGIPYDFVDLRFPASHWQQRLADGEYLAVSTGGLYADFNFLAGAAKELKSISPATPFILGGNITTDINRAVLFDNIALDYAVAGEAEESLPELLFHLREQGTVKAPADIEGVIHRDAAGQAVFTGKRQPLDIRRTNVYPTWDDINVDHYLEMGLPGYERMRAMPVLTGRGCTGRCIFCSPTNGRYRVRSVEHVMEELHRLNKQHDFSSFVFLNEIMYPTAKMMHEFLEAYKASGIGKTWIACLRVDVGTQMLKAMQDAGCIGANCGLESGSDRVLGQIQKGITVQQLKKFYMDCKEIALPAQAAFMFGNETETREELVQTVDLLLDEEIFSIGGSLVIAYPGTELYRRALAQGRIEDEFEYIKNLNYSDISTNGTFRNVGYLNMSAMDDDTLFRVTTEQSRRQRTGNLRKFSATKIDFAPLTGECSVCGTRVTCKLNPESMLDHVSYCDKCFSPVFFNFYQADLFSAHTAKLRAALSGTEKIAVWGVGTNAGLLHMYDVFGLDLEKICCFVDERGSWQGEYFFNGKVVTVQQFKEVQPDFLLIADTQLDDLEERLAGSGFPEGKMMSVIPAAWRALAAPASPAAGAGAPREKQAPPPPPPPARRAANRIPGDGSAKGLFVSLKWTDAHPSRPLSSSFIFMDSYVRSGKGAAVGFFCDEHIYRERTQCDEALYRTCLKERPDFLFLFPTQLDGTIELSDEPAQGRQQYFLFPRNETFRQIRETLGIPIITAVGDAYGRDAFDRFEAMEPFSDTILLFDPEVDFLQWTATPQRYTTLWAPIQHDIFHCTGQPRDIGASFIGRTHPSRYNEAMPHPDHPLHQYAYRDLSLQAMIAKGCPVFRAGGAQLSYPLSPELVADYFRRSKITLNFSYQTESHKLLRGRVWEAMNCGPLLLEEENASIRHFLEPMTHYVPFSEPGDAVEKINYFLARDAYREKIAAAGQRMASKVYNDSRFWDELLKVVDQAG